MTSKSLQDKLKGTIFVRLRFRISLWRERGRNGFRRGKGVDGRVHVDERRRRSKPRKSNRQKRERRKHESLSSDASRRGETGPRGGEGK